MRLPGVQNIAMASAHRLVTRYPFLLLPPRAPPGDISTIAWFQPKLGLPLRGPPNQPVPWQSCDSPRCCPGGFLTSPRPISTCLYGQEHLSLAAGLLTIGFLRPWHRFLFLFRGFNHYPSVKGFQELKVVDRQQHQVACIRSRIENRGCSLLFLSGVLFADVPCFEMVLGYSAITASHDSPFQLV